jgi:acyl-CoA thioesterase YciA
LLRPAADTGGPGLRAPGMPQESSSASDKTEQGDAPMSMQTPTSIAPETVPRTEPALRAIAMPADTNPHGDIFGGWLLCQMDLAGTVYATRRALGRVVTVAVTGMVFHRPVMVGDEVTCFCEIEKIGTTSITVKIQTWVKRGIGDDQIKVTEGTFTYVKVDAVGKPQPVAAS